MHQIGVTPMPPRDQHGGPAARMEREIVLRRFDLDQIANAQRFMNEPANRPYSRGPRLIPTR